jgi:hypothetical protein
VVYFVFDLQSLVELDESKVISNLLSAALEEWTTVLTHPKPTKGLEEPADNSINRPRFLRELLRAFHYSVMRQTFRSTVLYVGDKDSVLLALANSDNRKGKLCFTFATIKYSY